jgi:hypothetical protein
MKSDGTCVHRQAPSPNLAHLAEEAEEAEGPQDAELLDPRVAAVRGARVLGDGRIRVRSKSKRGQVVVELLHSDFHTATQVNGAVEQLRVAPGSRATSAGRSAVPWRPKRWRTKAVLSRVKVDPRGVDLFWSKLRLLL